MSKKLEYADDFKIAGSNPVLLGTDVKEIWTWCKEILISAKLTKSKAVPIKGCPNIGINDLTFGILTAVKDLDLIPCSNLSWIVHTKKRASKALNALFSPKRSFTATTLSIKRNADKVYVIPILSCRSSVWKPSKSDVSVLEIIQTTVVMRILNTNSISYKDLPIKLGILSSPLYRGLYVVLLLTKNLNGKLGHYLKKIRKYHRHW